MQMRAVPMQRKHCLYVNDGSVYVNDGSVYVNEGYTLCYICYHVYIYVCSLYTHSLYANTRCMYHVKVAAYRRGDVNIKCIWRAHYLQ